MTSFLLFKMILLRQSLWHSRELSPARCIQFMKTPGIEMEETFGLNSPLQPNGDCRVLQSVWENRTYASLGIVSHFSSRAKPCDDREHRG